MRALRYHGAKDVSVDTVPDPDIVEKDDIILRVDEMQEDCRKVILTP